MYTYAYLYFNGTEERHVDFKMATVNAMLSFNEVSSIERRSSLLNNADKNGDHVIKRIKDKDGKNEQKECYYCQHGRGRPDKHKTRWYCGGRSCGIQYPYCSPTVCDCYQLHIIECIPAKRRYSKK